MYLITEGSSHDNALHEPDADRRVGPTGALKRGTRRPASPSLNGIRGVVLSAHVGLCEQSHENTLLHVFSCNKPPRYFTRLTPQVK